MKRMFKPFSLLVTFLLLFMIIAAAASCGDKDKAPVFEEMQSERIAAFYGDAGLIFPGSKYICYAYEKTDFEAICKAVTTEDYQKKLEAFYTQIDFKDLTLDPGRIDELLEAHVDGVAYDDPVYVCDLRLSDKEIVLLDTIFAEVFGLEVDTTEAAPAG
ncbi:MAG: hypothetical protein GX897_03640 [Clostridiales bacterium]|nr:hypothetical protein [Clostridiales bacterium]